MDWHNTVAPSLADFEALAQRAFADLPGEVRRRCGDVVILVADFADEETLSALAIDDPYELTGLYAGVDLTRKSIGDAPEDVDRVWLYRRPMLDEWAERADETLGALVTHVLIHEIGHHFGFTDEAMDALVSDG